MASIRGARPGLADERGSAIVTVVLVTFIGSLLATSVLTLSASTVASSTDRKLWEQAFHLAEAGAARALSLIAADPDYDTGAALPPSPTRDEVAAEAGTPEETEEGEYAWVVPEGRTVAYGVGYAPSAADPVAVRVVQVDYRVVLGTSARALLTEGDLTVEGSARIEGIGGSVHANGILIVEGTAAIEKDATAYAGPPEVGPNATVGGTVAEVGRQVLPAVAPPEHRHLADYDVCPDATIRVATGDTPCLGTIAPGFVPLMSWNGWERKVLPEPHWSVNCGQAAAASVSDNKAYYVHLSSVTVTCPASADATWRATIITEGSGPPGSMLNGDILVSGSGAIQAARSGIALVAGRDLRLSGGPPLEVAGLVIAGEQISLDGSASIVGSVVAAGVADSLGSPVAANRVAGGFRLRALFGTPALQGGIQPLRWQELPG